MTDNRQTSSRLANNDTSTSACRYCRCFLGSGHCLVSHSGLPGLIVYAAKRWDGKTRQMCSSKLTEHTHSYQSLKYVAPSAFIDEGCFLLRENGRLDFLRNNCKSFTWRIERFSRIAKGALARWPRCTPKDDCSYSDYWWQRWCDINLNEVSRSGMLHERIHVFGRVHAKNCLYSS